MPCAVAIMGAIEYPSAVLQSPEAQAEVPHAAELCTRRCVVEALTAKKPRTRYAIVAQHFQNWTLPMWLPDRLMDTIMAKAFIKTA